MDETEYDLAIIGGGINGAAMARDASLRGLKVILIEKKDFGFGASSKNSKLAHGGLRYLEQFQFSLVKESLRERSFLLTSAPNLVKKLPFIIPCYQEDRRPLWMIKFGLYLYDFLGAKDLESHKNLSSQKILELFPKLKKETLQGGCIYYDALMRDNRLVMENILSAEEEGATILNYTPVTDLHIQEGKVRGVVTSQGVIKAKAVVNATGAWSDSILELNHEPPALFPTKGVHLVLQCLQNSHALLLFAPQDGRVFFLIPWNGYSLLGTTDTPFSGDADDVHVEQADIIYLLTALSHYFPSLELSEKQVIASFAGLRPLIHNHHEDPSKISRDHRIQVSSNGLISLLGGKYTTYRQIAEETVDTVIARMPHPERYKSCETSEKLLCPPAPLVSGTLEKRLMDEYGRRGQHILDIISASPHEARVLCSWHPHVAAEVIYAIRYEKAKTPEDWFERRTSIAYTECRGQACAKAVQDIFDNQQHFLQDRQDCLRQKDI